MIDSIVSVIGIIDILMSVQSTIRFPSHRGLPAQFDTSHGRFNLEQLCKRAT
ncbi:hypothetical protein L861_16705 [Litchfieldella anticariensis FP35 = DSM 16096]|uniref:Uncharacterized protein n=1 Tax=Litchfieldella anticariensis (strain DSM 16096 / CECT 5854 / CIP 108499 / LMG 22089 / FP35) TaxID=1121939 RepID=S2L9Y2_LITA3|nr:hypothetical protein L861_16705 [Halomonas anticariensis FP35 = DSM 16096]